MKRKNKIYRRLTILLLVIYLALLLVLYLSEHTDSQATIRSFRDAFWYSLVTLTTVGYGDITPVTPLGKFVGVIFLLMSAGIMMTLFGAMISFVTSEGLPYSSCASRGRKTGIILQTLVSNLARWRKTSTRKILILLLYLVPKEMIRQSFQTIPVCLSMPPQPAL